MENATKALLIAASVLIAIVLIAVGIKILSSTQGVTNEVDKVTTATGLSIHNSQFTDYEGTITGTELKALLNKAVATHRDGSSHKVTVVVAGESYTDANRIADYRATISASKTYTVSVEYDTNGYVNKLKVD